MPDRNRHIKRDSESKDSLKILKELDKGYLSPELEEEIRSWLISSGNQEEKDEALKYLFEKYFRFDPRPEKIIYKLMRDIHKRLGFPEEVYHSVPFSSRILIKVAAILLPIIGLVAVTFFLSRLDVDTPQFVKVDVPESESKIIVLPDSSEVRISPETYVSYAADFKENRVVHINGEAYFTVRPMDGKTFEVHGKHVAVTVLGTEFNIKDYETEDVAEVSLTKGKVAVQANGRRVELEPMTQLRYDKDEQDLVIREVKEEEVLRMKKMPLIFEGVPLDEALLRVGDYFGMKVQFEGSPPGKIPIRIHFDLDDEIDNILFVMQNITKTFKYDIKQDTIMITNN